MRIKSRTRLKRKRKNKVYLQKICDLKSSQIIQEEKPGRTREMELQNQTERKLKTMTGKRNFQEGYLPKYAKVIYLTQHAK